MMFAIMQERIKSRKEEQEEKDGIIKIISVWKRNLYA